MSEGIDAQYWIDMLALVEHPEGGFYRETYRSSVLVDVECVRERHARKRAMATSIYYLLRSGETSKLHRLASDEIWHYHAGLPIELAIIDPHGVMTSVRIGPDATAGEVFQTVIPAGSWFGASVVGATVVGASIAGASAGAEVGYALVSCTVAPGFDFADFEMGRRDRLLAEFPQHRATIERLTAP